MSPRPTAPRSARSGTPPGSRTRGRYRRKHAREKKEHITHSIIRQHLKMTVRKTAVCADVPTTHCPTDCPFWNAAGFSNARKIQKKTHKRKKEHITHPIIRQHLKMTVRKTAVYTDVPTTHC